MAQVSEQVATAEVDASAGVSDPFWRQLDIFDPKRFSVPVTVIGAGAIGSFAVLALTKMGVRDVTVWDGDTVSEHNLPNQFFRVADVGRKKVEALAEIVRAFNGVEISPRAEMFDGLEAPRGIVISAVDSMAARSRIWAALRNNPWVTWYVDARMGGEVYCRYVVRVGDAEQRTRYEATLYSDASAVPQRCTAKAIMYNVLGVAGDVAAAVKAIATQASVTFQVDRDAARGMVLLTA